MKPSSSEAVLIGLATLVVVPFTAQPFVIKSSYSNEHACKMQVLKAEANGIHLTNTAGILVLPCPNQKLEGYVASDGLWVKSTKLQNDDKVHLVAQCVWRESSFNSNVGLLPANLDSVMLLSRTGSVSIRGGVIQFVRPGLVEEYSASPNGLRQDFIVLAPPNGNSVHHKSDNTVCVQLALTGAIAYQTDNGVRLVLGDSGAELTYKDLFVTDAEGRVLSAQFHVMDKDTLLIRVNDAHAAYPIRIDPTITDADWDTSLSPGYLGVTDALGGEVYKIFVDTNGDVYFGGLFKIAGSVVGNCIAKWDGTNWTALGSGLSSCGLGRTYVSAIAKVGNELIVGGAFLKAGDVWATNIAKWNGQDWSALGNGATVWPETVSDIAVSGDTIYVASRFTNIPDGVGGVVPISYFGKWDGYNWVNVGSSPTEAQTCIACTPQINRILVVGNDIYVSGWFTKVGGVNATNIARWDGTNWHSLGVVMNGAIYTLAYWKGALYVGGSFNSICGIQATNIAKWDGTNWSCLDVGLNGPVYALCPGKDALYVGGLFTAAGEIGLTNIAMWDGTNWSALGRGVNGSVYTIGVGGTNVYVGGTFTVAGGKIAKRIARWDGTTWWPMGVSGAEDVVRALAVSGTNLYIGGGFDKVGNVKAKRIARWDGEKWSALGSGITNYWVHALAVDGTNLYVGGTFTNAGGVPANKIARWDGHTWSALGSGVNEIVRTIVVGGGYVYAGGDFTIAGGQPANYVARWDGEKWSPLGDGVNGPVYALALSSNILYAGGSFTSAGGVLAKYIAKWDGTNWSALGSGVSSLVRAILVADDGVYVGGRFGWAGDLKVNRVAKWDGTAWHPLGSGVDVAVYALAKYGRDIYAAGFFTIADGIPAGHVARWDGHSWSPVGSGVDFWVYALATDDAGRLFVAGDFVQGGGKAAPYLAQVYLTPEGGAAKAIVAEDGNTRLTFVGRPGRTYAIQRATDPMFTRDLITLCVTNAPKSCVFDFIDSAPPQGKAFYRLVQQLP